MEALPPAAKLAIGGVLLAVVCWAFFGRPARRRPPRLVGLLVGAGITAYVMGVAGVYLELAGSGPVIAFALASLCLAVWLGRAPAGEDDDDGPDDDQPGPEPDDDGSSPVDWGEFDRARARWAQPRAGAPRRSR
jgi:hypothetical protein